MMYSDFGYMVGSPKQVDQSLLNLKLLQTPDHPRIGNDKHGSFLKDINGECTWSRESDRFIIACVIETIWAQRCLDNNCVGSLLHSKEWEKIREHYGEQYVTG